MPKQVYGASIMNKWKYQFQMKDLLSDSNDQSLAQIIGSTIATRLNAFRERHKEFEDDFELDDIIGALDAINTVEQWESLCAEEDSTWSDLPPINELNEWLSPLYDWCDSNRVWVN